MNPIDPLEVRRRLDVAAGIQVADTRGKAFEAVADYLFSSLGCMVRGNLTSVLHSEQIDLVVAHLGFLSPIPPFFLVECKFWEQPVDSAAVGYFLRICETRQVPLAVIISRNGITGNAVEASAAHSLAYAGSMRGTHLIVLTEADLRSVRSNQDLINMVISAWLGAVATGGVGSP